MLLTKARLEGLFDKVNADISTNDERPSQNGSKGIMNFEKSMYRVRCRYIYIPTPTP